MRLPLYGFDALPLEKTSRTSNYLSLDMGLVDAIQEFDYPSFCRSRLTTSCTTTVENRSTATDLELTENSSANC